MMAFQTHDVEKDTGVQVDAQHEEGQKSSPVSESERTLEKATVLKLDLLLVPLMCALYLISFLDKANIGNARIAGLQKDLNLTDRQYQTAITITYVPYILAELPSNLLLKRVGPRIMLPGMCFCWGTGTTLQSLVHNYGGLAACRACLGLCEGGLFPGIVLYLSGFYKPNELQVRIGLFFSAAALSGAFSGLLAAAIQNMDGIAGLHGWQWIFLLEGLFTVLFAVFAFFVLPNNPHQVRSFSPDQADMCIRRLQAVKAQETHRITLKQVLSTFASPHIWILCLILFCNGVSLFGLAYFTPSIVASLEFSRVHTQLLSVPPFAIAFFVTMVAAYLADRYRCRGLSAFCTTCLALIGFSIFFATDATNKAVRYVALCFMVTGVYASAPSLISWIPNNVAAHARRATAIAMGFVATNVGGIISTWIYPKTSAPQYRFAATFNLALICFSLVLIVVEVWLLRRMNEQKVQVGYSGLSEAVRELDEREQWEVLGDAHPEFRYIL